MDDAGGEVEVVVMEVEGNNVSHYLRMLRVRMAVWQSSLPGNDGVSKPEPHADMPVKTGPPPPT